MGFDYLWWISSGDSRDWISVVMGGYSFIRGAFTGFLGSARQLNNLMKTTMTATTSVVLAIVGAVSLISFISSLLETEDVDRKENLHSSDQGDMCGRYQRRMLPYPSWLKLVDGIRIFHFYLVHVELDHV